MTALAGFVMEHMTAAASAVPTFVGGGDARQPALGLDTWAADPRQVLAEVGALVAEVLGRPVAVDQPLMEVRL